MTREEEDKIFQEIRDVVGPEIIAKLIVSGGNPSLDDMAMVGYSIEQEVIKRGLPPHWFLQYAVARAQEKIAEKNAIVVQEKAVLSAKTHPYKCVDCEERFQTTDKRRNHHRLVHVFKRDLPQIS